MNRVYLYSLDYGQDRRRSPTAGTTRASPCFSGDGKYLFFVSDRDFNPTYGADRVEPRLPRHGADLLRDAGEGHDVARSAPKSDEVEVKPDGHAESRSGRQEGRRQEGPEGPARRSRSISTASRTASWRCPSPAANYGDLNAGRRRRLLHPRTGTRSAAVALTSTTWHERKETRARRGRRLRDLGRRQEDARLARTASYGIIDLPKGADRHRARRSNLSGHGGRARPPGGVEADLRRVLAADARLLLRPEHARRRLAGDAATLRAAGRARQAPGRPDLRHRRDDRRAERRPRLRRRRRAARRPRRCNDGPARGGARARRRRPASYQIAKILQGRRTGTRRCARRSPRSASTSSEGDYIVAVNGRPTNERAEHLRSCWCNTAGKQVTLKVNGRADGEGARARSSSCPIADESDLYYYDWVQGNIEKVDRRPPAARSATSTSPTCGVDGPERVRQALLPAAAQEGADRRRPRQRRRQRLAA